jgi:Alpha galactosidase C-terminal beta sandwich domain
VPSGNTLGDSWRIDYTKPGAREYIWFSADGTGAVTVALFNLADTPATVTANWSDLGISPDRGAAVHDLWSHTDLGVVAHDFSARGPGTSDPL